MYAIIKNKIKNRIGNGGGGRGEGLANTERQENENEPSIVTYGEYLGMGTGMLCVSIPSQSCGNFQPGPAQPKNMEHSCRWKRTKKTEWRAKLNNHLEWLASRRIWSVEKLETLPASTKPRTSHYIDRLEEGVAERRSARWSLKKATNCHIS